MGAKASQKQDGSCVCLVTTGHPSTNPRLVKEADALTEAGYTVHVVACKFAEWADRADRRFSTRSWSVDWVRFGPMAGRWRDFALRLRRRLCREVVRRTGPLPGLAGRAAHYVVPELTRAAQRRPADLYIAHNLAALPAAARAAEKHDAGLGFDAEDFHRGELPETPNNEARLTLTRHLEETYMPRCDYLTAASDGIAEAYADTLGVPRPTTILNVFPRSERDGASVSEEELRYEKKTGTRSLYWFSQTIGPNRGLEDVCDALLLLPGDVHLYLRGAWASGYEDEFMQRATRLGVADRVHHLPLVPPDELIPRTARHDVGLALEQGHTRNRNICVTNKLFTYLLAGVPFVATDTEGQRCICEDLPEATRLCSIGEPEALADAVQSLLRDEETYRAARQAAWQAGEERYNWGLEKENLLTVTNTHLKK